MKSYLITPGSKKEEQQLLSALSKLGLEAIPVNASWLEDIAFGAAIEAGRKTKKIPESEVMKVLRSGN